MKTVKNESQLLYLQAKHQFEKAMKKFEDGTIKSEPQLIQAVFQSFHDFFTNMGKPHMLPRYASEQGPPWSEDYNEMMDEIKADLETLFQEIEILGRSLYTDFNHNVMQVDVIQTEYEKIQDKLKDLEMYAGHAHDGLIRFGRDDFFNGLKIDYDRISGTPLEITPTGVSLPLSGEVRNVARNAKVTIVPGNQKHDDYILGSDSNGFPGNNHEITMVSDDLLTGTYGYQFVGKDDNHGNYGAVIDGNPNTWFEYERVNLRDHEKRKIAKQLGWDYIVSGNKTLRFAEDPENGVLKLHLQIVLEKEEIINQINIDMYTPPNYGAKPAIVKNILVSSEYGAPVSVLPKDKQDADYHFRFDPIRAKVISILFEQEHKYYTDLGHIYYEKKMNITDERDYVFETLQHRTKPEFAPRVDGPKIHLESLGVKVDVHETNIQAYYPLKGAESQGYSLEDITNDLFMQIDERTIEAGIERFEGWRYAIGIRNIEILSCEYLPKGELVTKPYYFDRPVERIAISANETIGDLLSRNPILKYDWIKYYISIDDGKEWHPITPLEHEIRENDPPKMYTIQYVSSEDEIINDEYGYLETTAPVYALRLRIVIERPQEEMQTFRLMNTNTEENDIPNRYHSSTVQSFKLQVETKQAEEDSEASVYTVDYKDSGYEEIPPVPPEDKIPDLPPIVDDDPDIDVPPPGGGWDPTLEDIFITMDIIPDKWCVGKNLVISGHVTSATYIDKIDLYLNDIYIDTGLDGSQYQINGTLSDECPECILQGNDVPITLNTESQRSFTWVIPFSKAEELGLNIGDIVTAKITAEDAHSIDYEIINFIIEECEEPAICYELDSVIIHYFNEQYNEIRPMELDAGLLPYEFDNGEGVMVTVGWSQEWNAPTLMITNGYHEGENAFVIHAVGVRYYDLEGNSQIKWADNIADYDGAWNIDLIIGDPNYKPTYWLSDIDMGDYDQAPSLHGINSWLIVDFDEDWKNNHCPIDMDFKPSDYLAPEQPSLTGDDVYGCIEARKVFVQYYDVDEKELRIKTVDLDHAYRGVYEFEQNGNTIEALIGWYDEYQGISISINSTNNEPLYVIAVGMLIRDTKGIVRTVWSNHIVIETNNVNYSNLMTGKKKELNDLLWVDENGIVNKANAPYLDKEKEAVVFGFDLEITEQLCSFHHIIDDRPDAPNFDRIPPEIILLEEITDPYFYQNLVDDELFSLKVLVRDETYLKKWLVSTFTGSWDRVFEEVTLEDNIDLLIPIEVPEPIEYEEVISNKVDIIFVIDTSGSMSDEIDDVRNNLGVFVQKLQASELDVHLGFVGSRFNQTQQRSDMLPASEFSLDGVGLNSGTWETLAWRQITDTTYGAASLYDQLRPDAHHQIVMLTDTYITEPLTEDIINDLLERRITVSVIWEKQVDDEPDYEWITQATGGLSLDIKNPNFHEEMDLLAEGVISKFSYIPDSSHVIVIRAEDEAGNVKTKEIVLNLTDRFRQEGT